MRPTTDTRPEHCQDRHWTEREGGGLVALLIVCTVVLSLLPLARLISAALLPGPTGDWPEPLTVLASRDALRATLNTLEVALGSSAIALLVGGGLAILLASSRLATRRAIAFLLILSVMIAPQVAALAFKTLAGPASPILKAMALAPPPGTRNPLLGSFGIILVMGLHHAPLVAITLAGGLAAIPRSLIEAAQLDGASAPRILISVLLPLLRPYAVAAALLVFVAGVGNFGIPALLGLPVGYVTLPTLIYQKLASFGPRLITDAAALSLLVGSIAAMGVVAALALSPREATRLDADERLAPFLDFGRGRLVVEGAVWLFLAVTILLPMLSLLATALVPAYGVALTWDTFTLSRFTEVLIRQSVTLRALTNSLMLAGSAAVSLAVLSILIGYAVERRGKRWRVPALTLIEMPYALPGVVLAIACILLFLKPLPLIGISLYATPWIILFAYHARFLPVVLKPVLAALATQERDSEDAAAVYGASLLQRLCYVIVPHVLPAAVAGGMLAFLFAFNELTVSALLWSAGTETIGVALLSLEDAGLGAEAAAIGVVTIVVVATLMFMLDALHRWFPRDVLPWRIIAR